MVSVVCVLLGVRILLGVGQSLIPQSTGQLLVNTWLIVSLVLLIWQVVGCWRACDRYLVSGGDTATGYIGYLAIPTTIVLAVLQLVDGVTSGTRMNPAPAMPITELPIVDNGTTVRISGKLQWDTHTALSKALENNPSIDKVVLNSKGGWVFTARGLALLVTRHGLDTHVDGQCFSACTIVFLAGANRSMGAEAQLGFHQYVMEKPHLMHSIDIEEELTKDRRYFVSRGVSENFVARVFQADKDSMWIPDRTLLLKEGVLTRH